MSPTICSFPFSHTDIEPNGEIKYCCASMSGEHQDANGKIYNINTHTLNEAWNSDRLKKLRLSLIAGEKPEACKFCWEQEEKTGNSLRLNIVNRLPTAMVQDRIDEAAANDGHLSKQAFDFQVSSGNLCNLACKMCNPATSTNFSKFFKKFMDSPSELSFVPNIVPHLNHDADFDAVYDWPVTVGLEKVFEDHYDSLRSLFLTGGEPTLIKENIDFLDKLDELGYNNQVRVWPSTNCTNINRRLLDTLSKFQRIELNLSLDGMDEIAYIQRTPSDWPSIEDNVDALMAWQLEQLAKGKSVKFNVITTLTSLNFHHVMDFWCYIVKRYPNNEFFICEPSLVWHKSVNFGIEGIPQAVVNEIAKTFDREFTKAEYDKIKIPHSYMKDLVITSKFSEDYATMHYCLDQVQRFHPDLDIKKIYSIYYK
jgi:organic radical activating enzyme